MQVAMVDINHLTCIFIDFSVGNGPTDPSHLRKVDDAFVVSVVKLSWPNQRIYPRGVYVVSQRFDDDPHILSLDFMEEW
jgi:hypothetical protein